MKHHSGIISEFRRRYVKTGAFDNEMSDLISELSIVREGSDYNDFFVVSKPDTLRQVEAAEYYIARIQNYLQTQY